MLTPEQNNNGTGMPSLADVARQSLGFLNVGRMLRLRARMPPVRNRPFIIFQGRRWTYAETLAEAKRFARLFRSHRLAAVRRGELGPDEPLSVGLYMENRPVFLFALFGAALEGDRIVGLNTGFRGEVLAAVLDRSNVRLAITTADHQQRLLDAVDTGTTLQRDDILVDDVAASDGLTTVNSALGRAQAERSRRKPKGAEPLVVIFTSGTTGIPKGIPCSHLKMIGAAILLAAQLKLRRRDRGYIAMPLFHSNALFIAVMPSLFAGASFVLKPHFSASAFETDILEGGVTWMNYVGQPVHYIVSALENQYGTPAGVEAALARHPKNRMRTACGNGATGVDREKLKRYLNMDHIYEVYGSTEAVIGTVLRPGDPPDSVGRVPSSRVVILDENDRECPPAEVDDEGRLLNYDQAVGEIAARMDKNNLLFDGYLGKPDATDSKYRNGYFHSGDLGHIRVIRGKRYLYFDGRTDDWIRKDGENFSAENVAQFAQALPGVHLAAAYGVPDPVADERVAVGLELEPGAEFDPQAAWDHFTACCEEGMDPKWMPDFIRVVDKMPTSGTNKILVRHLKKEHFNLRDNPEMAIWYCQRGESTYHRLTRTEFEKLEDGFRGNGRENLLQTGWTTSS
jgi:fatty-acyl-CoA synthase